jgi:hypothetical protein
MRAFAKHQTDRKNFPDFTVNYTHQMLSETYVDVAPPMSTLLSSVYILDGFWILESFIMLDKGMDSNRKHETFYTAQCQ